ncbi:unnamed protein product [Pleuronectes platessa]|uniref:Uncharacterized protein n=1 Tax=Pleuronectes platessa TaxID=8262 RepID=A0A9N7UYM8_PLEPL|nr:unnamed protein product [Pleuronectes platessa]
MAAEVRYSVVGVLGGSAVLDDRSKILTTSVEKRGAQPGRERRRPDRSTGLHRGDAPLDKGEKHGSQPLVDQVCAGCAVWDQTVCRLQLCAASLWICISLVHAQIKQSVVCLSFHTVTVYSCCNVR